MCKFRMDNTTIVVNKLCRWNPVLSYVFITVAQKVKITVLFSPCSQHNNTSSSSQLKRMPKCQLGNHQLLQRCRGLKCPRWPDGPTNQGSTIVQNSPPYRASDLGLGYRTKSHRNFRWEGIHGGPLSKLWSPPKEAEGICDEKAHEFGTP